MARYCLVYITTGDEAEAEQIGETLVREKLVACVNLHPIKSIFWWEGEVSRENEVAMLVKTRANLVDAVIARVKELHSYEVPCVASLPIAKGNPDFLEWIDRSTR